MERALAARGGGPDYSQIGAHLRTRRQQLGLSLRELAERLGVSASLISQIERGRANPSVSTLYALVAELDVSLDDLLFSDGRFQPRSADGGPATPTRAKASAPIQRGHDRQHIRLASGVIWERLTTMADIVDGVRFLLENPAVNGIDLRIDGGWLTT